MARMLISGERTAAGGGAEMPIVNPATEGVVDAVPQAAAADVDAAAQAAERAFARWSRLDPDMRAGQMRAGLERVRARGQAIVDPLVREHGLEGLEEYLESKSVVIGGLDPPGR